jgi:hypothetical protein
MYDQTPENDTIMEDIATQPPHKWRPTTYIGIVFGCFIGMLIVIALIRAMIRSRSRRPGKSEEDVVVLGDLEDSVYSDQYGGDSINPLPQAHADAGAFSW